MQLIGGHCGTVAILQASPLLLLNGAQSKWWITLVHEISFKTENEIIALSLTFKIKETGQ